ncbi:MAG: 16S rRNA (guanine(966)-N(2))-methyltransferase RsmD [Caldicoprobacterales bacterium]|jgi:16S rRNA (guanine966-N2)-methyltransferase|nr:16S rRNA (guanine(966)-N(2))-methyltransferase RsmD [Clostridiales bacterium]
MLRIISGEHKGRIIKTPAGENTRPTTDRVKESLFNILQFRLHDSNVLDLFSGSGNLGFESLSRGARNVVFVEKNVAALKVLKDNCYSLGYTEKTRIIPYDVERAIKLLSKEMMVFDIIFMDPPYTQCLVEPTMVAVQKAGLLKDDGILVVEHSKCCDTPALTNKLIRIDIRQYGKTAISFYQKLT